MKQKIRRIKEEIDNSSTVVADSSTPLSIIDKITTKNKQEYGGLEQYC